MAGAASYATTTDVGAYLPSVVVAEESAGWAILLSVASRAIDRFCDRYFYSNANSVRYFDGDGSTDLYVAKHDFYTVTALKIALTENNDPADSTLWYTIHGDGVTPPSNFYLGPDNQTEIGSVTDQTLKRPYYNITIPGNPWSGSTTDYLPTFTKGRRTVSIAASWGWPAVPDEIKDITIKLTIRMWRAKETGQTSSVGSADFGVAMIAKYLDVGDLETLHSYRKHTVA